MRKSLIALAGAVALMPQIAVAQKAFSLSEIKERLAPTIEVMTNVASWLGPKPDPIAEFSYAETRRFDMQLHRSLGADLPMVNVLVGGAFGHSAVPQRAGQWIKAIGGGNVLTTCVVNDDRGLLKIVGLIVSALRQIDTWVLFAPAKSYDLTLIVTDKGSVSNMLYSARGTVTNCPSGTTKMENVWKEQA